MIVWIVGIFFLILVILLGIAVYTDSKESNKYPCIENTNKGYVIYNKLGEYKTTGGNWWSYSDMEHCHYIQTLNKAIEIFHNLGLAVVNEVPLGRVYGLEHIQKEKEIKSKTALLEEIIAVDKKNGENTDVLESILLRQKEELLA